MSIKINYVASVSLNFDWDGYFRLVFFVLLGMVPVHLLEKILYCNCSRKWGGKKFDGEFCLRLITLLNGRTLNSFSRPSLTILFFTKRRPSCILLNLSACQRLGNNACSFVFLLEMFSKTQGLFYV